VNQYLKDHLGKFDPLTPALTPGRNSCRRTKGERTLIEEGVLSINIKAKKKTITKTKMLKEINLLKNSTNR
jgi:hypothetical protein